MIEFDSFLRQINSSIRGAESAGYTDASAAPPAIHVVGAPRTGTTLLMQVLSSTLDVGYIDNLAALFWSAPVFGILASRKLLGTERPPSQFLSNFGRTEGISEPHEFGRFWLEVLQYEDMAQKPQSHEDNIDWKALRAQMRNMGLAFGRPYLMKSFLLIWHLARFHATVPESLYIRMKRPMLDTALSILKLRKARGGDPRVTASLTPLGYGAYKDEPWPVQIAAQVHFIHGALDEGLATVPTENVLDVQLEDLRSAPDAITDRVILWLAGLGYDARRVRNLGAIGSASRSDASHSPEEIALLSKALQSFGDNRHA